MKKIFISIIAISSLLISYSNENIIFKSIGKNTGIIQTTTSISEEIKPFTIDGGDDDIKPGIINIQNTLNGGIISNETYI